MTSQLSVDHSLAAHIVGRVEELLREAQRANRPLELEPYRGSLFELFVVAEAAGLVGEDSQPDLSSDGIARELAARWDLADAARESFTQQSKLPNENLAQMRVLWSFMRMWMEWTYAWARWHEFHDGGPSATASTEND